MVRRSDASSPSSSGAPRMCVVSLTPEARGVAWHCAAEVSGDGASSAAAARRRVLVLAHLTAAARSSLVACIDTLCRALLARFTRYAACLLGGGLVLAGSTLCVRVRVCMHTRVRAAWGPDKDQISSR